jgi:CYTH domain-containing protein
MTEIEYKYTAQINAEALLADKRLTKLLYVRQGYIIVCKSLEWRIRRTEYIIPDKGVRWHTAIKLGNGFIRKEYEVEIPAAIAKHLAGLVPQWLYKRRVEVNNWAVDSFSEKFDGLHLAETELERPDEPVPEVPNGLFIRRDVTEEGTFANKRLSRLSWREARKLVVREYPLPQVTPIDLSWIG